ncbi:MAG: DUF4295 domain-containing protein [Bacteroidota bacterium]|nr:DUF4295 domain-containing protein [Bacteroidota bacterium]
MAKKAVASLQKRGAKDFTKVIKMTKSEKTGSYTFRSEIVPKDKVNDYLAKK